MITEVLIRLLGAILEGQWRTNSARLRYRLWVLKKSP
jgi:hypothetical protein